MLLLSPWKKKIHRIRLNHINSLTASKSISIRRLKNCIFKKIFKAISACRFLKVEGSYMQGFTVLGASVLVSIIMNEAISACRFLKVQGSYMRASTVFGAIEFV